MVSPHPYFDLQVHFLEYDEDSGSLGKSIYAHRAGEIWRMASSPNDYQRFATIYQNSERRNESVHLSDINTRLSLVQDSNVVSKCSVWQIPTDSTHDESSSPTIDESSNQLHQPLRKRFDLNVPNSNMIE